MVVSTACNIVNVKNSDILNHALYSNLIIAQINSTDFVPVSLVTQSGLSKSPAVILLDNWFDIEMMVDILAKYVC